MTVTATPNHNQDRRLQSDIPLDFHDPANHITLAKLSAILAYRYAQLAPSEATLRRYAQGGLIPSTTDQTGKICWHIDDVDQIAIMVVHHTINAKLAPFHAKRIAAAWYGAKIEPKDSLTLRQIVGLAAEATPSPTPLDEVWGESYIKLLIKTDPRFRNRGANICDMLFARLKTHDSIPVVERYEDNRNRRSGEPVYKRYHNLALCLAAAIDLADSMPAEGEAHLRAVEKRLAEFSAQRDEGHLRGVKQIEDIIATREGGYRWPHIGLDNIARDFAKAERANELRGEIKLPHPVGGDDISVADYIAYWSNKTLSDAERAYAAYRTKEESRKDGKPEQDAQAPQQPDAPQRETLRFKP